MTKEIRKILIGLTVIGIIFVFHHSLALGEDFVVDVFPRNPGPNQKVNVSLTSYTFDINRADITWMVNGLVKSSGVGKKEFGFSTGDVGSATTLSIIAITKEGYRMEKNFVFRPAEIDLLWEAETYTPIYYKGKALPTSESYVKVTALPNFVYKGSRIPSSNLVFEWEVNGKKIASFSGYGKDSVSFKGSEIFGSDKVRVSVSSISGIITAESYKEIAIAEPKIVFYEDSPLEGTKFATALSDSVDVASDEIILRSEPYFFSIGNLRSLSYNWKMNNTEIEPDENKNTINLRVAENISGTAIINLKIENESNILQFAQRGLKVNFGI